MYLVVIKRKDTAEYVTTGGIRCAMLTLCKVTGKKMHEDELIFMCKVPDKEGDETLISKYFQKYPMITPTTQCMYSENDATKHWESLGGNKNNIGHSLVTRICRMNNVKYVLVPEKDI